MKGWVFFLIILLSAVPAAYICGESESGWRVMTWEDKASADRGPVERALSDKLEEVLSVLRHTAALDPPGRVNIQPNAALLPPAELPGGSSGPVRARLSLSIWEPGPKPEPSVLTVWFNDPYHLLGDPVLTDSVGQIYLLPPRIPGKGGRELRSREAHPPGYEEKYPSQSFYPLWGAEVAPFLRSVVRPTFGLAERSVTTLFSSKNRSFWKPVSQERWILALLERGRAELRAFQESLRAAGESEVTERHIAGLRRQIEQLKALFDERAVIERHEESLEQARDLIEMAKSMGPEMHEKVKADMQAKVLDGAEERLEEALAAAVETRAEIESYEQKLLQALLTREEVWTDAANFIERKDWDSLEELGRSLDMNKFVFLADTGRSIAALEGELASLSPAERKAAAWGFELPPWNPLGTQRHVIAMPFDPDRPSGLLPAGTEGARQLVSIDPDFVAAGSSSDVKLLTVSWHEKSDILYHGKNGPQREKTGKLLLDAVWESLDWRRLGGFID